MPTPSIQTLTTDAQQVLNLDSISAVRSVVAVALANANTGTPLNPNLTTQQLWDQFYQVVTRPKSDIESIIANQLMKFLYSPPAPGGAGADKQVIFNDGGVLAGDADFLWNKTTNLLTVTGSATITGDLTVRTNKLAVTSSGVGFGTASPSAPIQVGDTTGSPEIRMSGASTAAAGPYLTFYKGGTRKTLIGNEAVLIGSGTSDALMFYTEGGNGIKWNIGSSTPSMTLDSSGNLGLGVTPSAGGGVLQLKSGITFPATQVASSDANTLDDYEEGTWTPTDASGAGLTFTVSNCRYTKVGRLVTVQGSITYPATANGSNATWGGFPFNSSDSFNLGIVYTDVAVSSLTYISSNGVNAFLLTPGVNVINSTVSGKTIAFYGTYMI